MTVAHPAAISLAPPARDRTGSSRGKAATTERHHRLNSLAGTITAGSRTVAPAAPVSPETRARHITQARIGLIAVSALAKVALAVALAAGLYLFFSGGVIGSVTDSFASWYTASVAPHLSLDLAVSEAPAGSPSGLSAGVPPMLRPVG